MPSYIFPCVVLMYFIYIFPGSSLPTQLSKKLHLAVNQVGRDVLKTIFCAMYEHIDNNSDGGGITLKEWLTGPEYLNKSKRELRKIFHGDVDEVLCDSRPTDVTFSSLVTYIQLIKDVNTTMYEKHFSDEFFESLKKIKELRNNLAHNASSSIDISTITGVLEPRYLSLLEDAASSLCGNKNYFDDEKKRVKDDLLTIIQGRDKLFVKKLKEKVPKELSSSHDFSMNPFFASEEHLKYIFETPWLMDNEEKLKVPFDLFSHGSKGSTKSRVTLLHGPGGCGKTAFCLRLLYEWCHRKNGIKVKQFFKVMQWDLVFLIQMRFHCYKSLLQYIKEYYLRDTANEYISSMDDFQEICERCKVLFILDGYDEKGKDGATWLEEVLAIKNGLGNVDILLTTRSAYISEATSKMGGFGNCRVILHKGFDQESRELFAKHVLEVSSLDKVKEKSDEFMKYLRDQEVIKADNMFELPLNVVFVVWLWEQDEMTVEGLRQLRTSSSLYNEFFSMLKKKIKLRENVGDRLTFSQDEVFNCCFDKFCQCTKKQLTSEDFQLTLSMRNYVEFCKFCEEKGFPPDKFCSGMLTHEEAFTNGALKKGKEGKQRKHQFRYFHRIQAEFLAAKAITADLINFDKEMNNLRILPKSHDFEPMLIFITGILTLQQVEDPSCECLNRNAEKIIEFVLQTKIYYNDLDFLFKLTSQTQTKQHSIENPCNSFDFCTKLSNSLSLDWTLKKDVVLPGLQLLGHFHWLELRTLEIDFAEDFNVEKNEHFCKSLKASLQKLRRCTGLNETELSVSLKHHCYDGNGISDDFLNPLLKGKIGLLLHVSGHFTEKFYPTLKSAKFLKILEVRVSNSAIWKSLIAVLGNLGKLKKLILIFATAKGVQDYCPCPAKFSRIEKHAIFFNADETTLDRSLEIVKEISK